MTAAPLKRTMCCVRFVHSFLLSAVDDRGPIEARTLPSTERSSCCFPRSMTAAPLNPPAPPKGTQGELGFPRSMTAAPLKQQLEEPVAIYHGQLSAVDDRGPIEAPTTRVQSAAPGQAFRGR